MNNWLKKSLIARGAVAMASITLIALLNIFASVIVADRAQGDAAAINVAGSLRLHVTRLAYLLQKNPATVSQPELQQQAAMISSKMHSNDLARVLQYHHKDDVRALHDQLVSTWHNQIEPAFYDSSLSRIATRTYYDSYLDSLVNNADQLVALLQKESEAKIRLLLAIQGGSMVLTIIVIVMVLYRLNSSIVMPLRGLVDAAGRIRQRDFSVTLEHERDDELGQLADAFNRMSEELNLMYRDLEQKVADQTAELLRSNRSLQLMYNAARTLSMSPYSTVTLHEITQELIRTTGVRHVSLCLDNEKADGTFEPMFFRQQDLEDRCASSNCDDCYTNALLQADSSVEIDTSDPAFPVRINRSRYGILFVEPRPGQLLAPWQVDLFTAISDTIATAVSLEKKAENESRLMLAEERAAMARDLHDSLAQSLSYLKFQVSRWQMLQARAADENQLAEVVNDIREGLNGAYKQLRELLATFRLKISDPGLEPALKGTVAEFSQRGSLDIALDYGLRQTRLTPNEEIHVLQIIREALSNITKHAQATHVWIELTQTDEHTIHVCVDDDGIGLPPDTEKQHHYGLSIMKERAGYLNAKLQLGRSPRGGTRVCLEYQTDSTSTVSAQQVNYV
ncbi:MAG: histidine kinase [Gammaproteobacteria bacterium]